ncbi:hypothetical protein PQX77_007946 [Marasmius sp. AFHP31]|nr:hypothetical protein PQX77_007946 [Marasmius sp. AFHP31]
MSKHKSSFDNDTDAFPGVALLTIVEQTRTLADTDSAYNRSSYGWWPRPSALKQLKDEAYRPFPSGYSLDQCLLNFSSSKRPNTPPINNGTVVLEESDDPSKLSKADVSLASPVPPSQSAWQVPEPSPLPKIATLDSLSKPPSSSGSGIKPAAPPFGPAFRSKLGPVSKTSREPLLAMRAFKAPRSVHEDELPTEEEEDSTDTEVWSIPAPIPLKTSISKAAHPSTKAGAKAAPKSSHSGGFRPSIKGSASSSFRRVAEDDDAMEVDTPLASSSKHIPTPPRHGVSAKQVARGTSRPRIRQPVSTCNSSLTAKAKALAIRVSKGKEVDAPKSFKIPSKPSVVISSSHQASSSRHSSPPIDEEEEEDDEEEEGDELDASGDDDPLASKSGDSKRKRETSLPNPDAPVTRSLKSEGARQRKAPSEDPSLVAEDEPLRKKVRRQHESADEVPAPIEEEDLALSYVPRRHPPQGKKTNAKSSHRKERTDFGPIPSPPASFEKVEVKPFEEMDFIDDNPPSLLPSLPGTNHVDSRNLGSWDGPASYRLTRDLGDINNSVHRKLRGTLSVPSQLDIEVHAVTNALAPMILPCQKKKKVCLFASSADEFDQLKVAFATWGESSEARIGRQMGEIAEGRRVVKKLILTRDSLNDQILHLASVDAARWSMPIIAQLCAVFDWECSEFPSSLVLERDEAGNCQLRNPSTHVVLPISSDFPSGTPWPNPSSNAGNLVAPEAAESLPNVTTSLFPTVLLSTSTLRWPQFPLRLMRLMFQWSLNLPGKVAHRLVCFASTLGMIP